MKRGNIRTDRQLDDIFAIVGGVVVILREALAHFARRNTHHRVRVRVIAGRASEDLDPDASFFQFGGVAQKRLLHGVRQQGRIALAVGEERMNQKPRPAAR